MAVNIRIGLPAKPGHLVITMIAIAVAIAGIHLVSHAPRYFDFTFRYWDRLNRLFAMGREANLAAWYSTMLLFTAGLLVAVIAAVKRQLGDRHRLHWIALAVIFFYLSADEAAVLHEDIGSSLGSHFSSKFLQFGGWIGVAVVGMAAFAAVFLPFWLALERHTKWRFALAGLIFVGGAMGVESLGVPYETGRPRDFLAPSLTALEELMEMSGIAIFIGALLDYIKRSYGIVEFDFNPTRQDVHP